MRRFLGLSLFFIICLAIALALNMPLIHVLAEVKLPDNVRLNKFRGTILSGKIDVLEVNRLQLTDLSYKNEARCIWTFDWCYRILFDQGEARISANIFEQSVTLSDSNLRYPVSEILALFPALLVEPTGEVEVKIDHLTVRQQQFALGSGALFWKQAGVKGESLDLGEYRLEAVLSNDAYLLTVRDNNALLKVDGKGQLKSNGQYNFNIGIESEPGLQNSIKTALEFVAKKRGLNKYSILHNGTLPQRIISQLSFEQS